MAVSSGTVSCPSNTATKIVAAANSNANASGARFGNLTVVLKNMSIWDCYIGPSTVGSSSLVLSAGASITLSLGAADEIYGKATQNSALIGYIITG